MNINSKNKSKQTTRLQKYLYMHAHTQNVQTLILCSVKIHLLFVLVSSFLCWETKKKHTQFVFDLFCFSLGIIRILTSVIFVWSTYSVTEIHTQTHNIFTIAIHQCTFICKSRADYGTLHTYIHTHPQYIAGLLASWLCSKGTANTVKIQSMITTNSKPEQMVEKTSFPF